MNRIVDQFLNVFWLRPETAMWRCIDANAMQEFAFRTPSMDFGCGDGVFSFLRSGGEFNNSFDVFQATTGLDKFFENKDVYDAFDEKLAPTVVQRPSYQIDVAFDHKENLLKKAATLGLYKSFKVGDGNAPLPFGDKAFASIFSNIVYWLDNPRAVLSELRRVLHDDGEICLMLPDKLLLDYSFYNSLYVKTGNPSWSWLERLDRGRLSDNIKQAKSGDEWEEIFHGCGLRVFSHTRHLSKPVIQMWDIGLRPLFPALMNMVWAIDPEKLPEIKAEFVSTIKQFIIPIIAMDENRDKGESAFHCYILKPQ